MEVDMTAETPGSAKLGERVMALVGFVLAKPWDLCHRYIFLFLFLF